MTLILLEETVSDIDLLEETFNDLILLETVSDLELPRDRQ